MTKTAVAIAMFVGLSVPGDNGIVAAGGDACEQCPCPEDLDRDGQVSFGDLLLVIARWGSCLDRYACALPWTCEKVGTICNETPLCVCFERFGGETFCVDLLADCNDMPACPDGTCPPGHVCLLNSCCGETICIALEWACLPGASDPERPRPATGTRTITGVVGRDGFANAGPCDLCFCPEDLDRDGATGVPDLLRLLGAWGPCE